MILAVSLVVAGVCLAALFVAVAREPGVSAADTAVAYETAWDRLDFVTLYDLSGDELRDGLDRRSFVAAKEAVYERVPEHGRLLARVEAVEESSADGVDGPVAGVVTRVTASDGVISNDLTLERRSNRWVVVAYALRADAPDLPDASEVRDRAGGVVAERRAAGEPSGPATTG